MKLKLFTLSVFSFLVLNFTSAQTNLFIDTSYTAEQMVMDFFNNSCVTPSNITYTGDTMSIAFFQGATTNLGVDAGIFLSTGNVYDASQSYDEFASSITNEDGDSMLSELIDWGTYDAAILEFDITVTGTDLDLEFKYVFGSEEYPEFVGTNFNDVFAFFISGPSITGVQNIAMVPGGPEPVAINSINADSNSVYFIDNMASMEPDIAFDGQTVELPANFTAMPGQTYHVKIAVADASDRILDSGVFLGVESLCGSNLLTPPANFNFTMEGNTLHLENTSRYATGWEWDFGDGFVVYDRNPEPHTYATPGNYGVSLTTTNYCCTDTYIQTVSAGTTSIEELAEKPFSIFPNPASGFINFELKGTSEAKVELFNPIGKLVKAEKISAGDGWDLSDYPKGIYLLRVEVDGENVHGTFGDKVAQTFLSASSIYKCGLGYADQA